MIKNPFRLIYLLLLGIIFQSCSLVKVESAQTPLSQNELNTRLLVQAFVQEASSRVEIASDSIKRGSSNPEIRINTLLWKIKTTTELKNTGFQTLPKLALLDTWSYLIQEKQFLDNNPSLFEEYTSFVKSINDKNRVEIEKIAKNTSSPSEYEDLKSFVESFAGEHALSLADYHHEPVREEYYRYRSVKDSNAVNTIGTLSEVVADLSNKMMYSSNHTAKQIQWNTELILAQNGLDSVVVDSIIRKLDSQIERFVTTVENSPESLDSAIISFRREIYPIFNNIDQTLISSVDKLREERVALDEMVLREREEFYEFFSEERKVISKEAEVLSKELVDEAMQGVTDLVKSILIYLILLFAVILFIPFGMGYYTGKIVAKRKKD
jgi:hypothetical protein